MVGRAEGTGAAPVAHVADLCDECLLLMSARSPTSSSYRKVIALAYPVVFSTLATTLMGLTDMLFMGHVSTAAQGGVGLGAILTWACAAFFVGTLTAINTFVAQYVGAGRPQRCGGVVWLGLALALGF